MVQKVHPFELPINTYAAVGYPSDDVVDADVPISEERQAQATAAIQEYVDRMAFFGITVEDPRLGPQTPTEVTITSCEPSTIVSGVQATVTVKGTGFTEAITALTLPAVGGGGGGTFLSSGLASGPMTVVDSTTITFTGTIYSAAITEMRVSVGVGSLSVEDGFNTPKWRCQRTLYSLARLHHHRYLF